jgi:hypothetical protein
LLAVVAGLTSCLAERWNARRSAVALRALGEPVPSARTIKAEDVLGAWQVCVDATAGAVTIDLSADGRCTQIILSNSGRRTECRGGTRTLGGPALELSDYRSDLNGQTGRVRWFFGDWQGHLALFAIDAPKGGATLLGLRARYVERS